MHFVKIVIFTFLKTTLMMVKFKKIEAFVGYHHDRKIQTP